MSNNSMPLLLSMVCHAPTPSVRRAAFPIDEPLDPAGLRAATAAARKIRRVDVAWTSPALRARQTASALGLTATIDPSLAEIDYWRWAGRTLDEVATTDPAGTSAWLSDPSAAPHGGESVDELIGRVAAWLVAVQGQSGRGVAVTHASVIRAALVAVLGASSSGFWRTDVAPLGRLRLRHRSGCWTVLSLHRTSLA